MLAPACGWRGRAQPVGEHGADADEPRGDHVGRNVEHATGVHIVEPLAIDEEQRETLLRRQAREEARGRAHRPHRRKLGEALLVDLRLPHRVGVVAELGEPLAVNLGEGPAVERPAPLIAMLLGEHEMKRAAKQRGRLRPLADEEIGEALEPRQHGDEPRPYGVVEFFCLHLRSPPPRSRECWLTREHPTRIKRIAYLREVRTRRPRGARQKALALGCKLPNLCASTGVFVYVSRAP